jgi:D-glycero-alpha-D-manno-heptose-7-phosphate kinase
VIVKKKRLAELQKHLMLCFTGFSRIAAEVAQSKIANLARRETELFRMREMVEEAVKILHGCSRPIEEFGDLLHQAWLAKKQLSEKVSTSAIDQIYDTAREAGAVGGKILGAGGGGFLLLFAKPENQPRVREALKDLVHVPFSFDESGSRVVLYQPNGLS